MKKTPIPKPETGPDGTRKVPLLNHRRCHIYRSKRFKILRGKILKPAIKMGMKSMPIYQELLCPGCKNESKDFPGPACHSCKIIIHTRPTNYRAAKKKK